MESNTEIARKICDRIPAKKKDESELWYIEELDVIRALMSQIQENRFLLFLEVF